jgi:hypothetical protein
VEITVMGQIDLENLFKIYYKINYFKKKHNLSKLNFKIDEGFYETAIEFVGTKHYHPPISKDWKNNPVILCPDLLDYNNRIIIEYEEEIGDRKSGAKLAKKGHNRPGDFPNKRDGSRNKYYKDGGFHYFQIWESEKNWQKKLEQFLLNV